MAYNFDEVIERRGSDSVKWNGSPPGVRPAGGRTDILPLWVADMDFRSPQVVLDAIARRVEHGLFGYMVTPASYLATTRDWLAMRHGWEVAPDSLIAVPGVVPSIQIAIEAFTRPGEKVIIQPPVYHPFRLVTIANGRQVVENPLRRSGTRYEMDFDQLARVIDGDTRLLVLCSPHNPVGRVWHEEELRKLVEICAERGVIVVSDEIHSDLILAGNRHVPTGLAAGAKGGSVVTLVSATKSFNLSSLSCAAAIVPDPILRSRFKRQIERAALNHHNPLSLAASEAAYRHGADWLEALLAYLEENYLFLVGYLREHAPALEVIPLEGTYLAWIDCSRSGYSDLEITKRLLAEGLWLEEGTKYGTGGAGFQRLNFACPRTTLEEGLARLVRALAG